MATKTNQAEKKYFLLLDKDMNVIGGYSGRAPRQAAIKAARRGYKDIRLRERGRRNKDKSWTIHIYQGSVERKKIDVKDSMPEWMKARAKNGKLEVKTAKVKKVGVQRVKKKKR